MRRASTWQADLETLAGTMRQWEAGLTSLGTNLAHTSDAFDVPPSPSVSQPGAYGLGF